MKRLSEFRTVFCVLLFPVALILAACGAQTGGNLSAWQEQYNLGMRCLTESNYEEAVLAFTAAIEIDPKQADTYIYLTQAYLGAGDSASAEQTRARGFAETGDARLSQSAAEGWVIYNEDIPFEQQLIYRDFSLLSAGQQTTLQQAAEAAQAGKWDALKDLLWQSSLPPQLCTRMNGYKVNLTILTKEEYSSYCAAYIRQAEAGGSLQNQTEESFLGANRMIYLEIRAENGPAYLYGYFEVPVVPQESGGLVLGSGLEFHEETACQGWQCQGPWSRQGRIWGGEGYSDQQYSWEETGKAVDNQITSRTYTVNLVSDSMNQTLVYREGVLQDVLVNGESNPWAFQMMEDSEGPEQPYRFARARW